jgi:predicted MPP superfamily phosphohydrolase
MVFADFDAKPLAVVPRGDENGRPPIHATRPACVLKCMGIRATDVGVGRTVIRVRSGGRGQSYSLLRGAIESSLRVLYRGDWPAKLWSFVPWACDVDVVVHRLALLPPGQPDLRVGFVSDLHVGPTTPERLLDTAFAHLAAARLDLLLLGGDYVFLDAIEDRVSALASRVQAVPAARKVAVLGNHDLWTRHAIIERALGRAGVELLINRSIGLESHEAVRIVGLDDPWTGAPDAALAFDGTRDAKAFIILCHSPDGLPHAQGALGDLGTQPEALYLCGHTHGGHIAMPWGPIVVPGRVGKRYPTGLHDVARTKLYVSRGVGGIELPIRSYARPEVALFEVTALDVAQQHAPVGSGVTTGRSANGERE